MFWIVCGTIKFKTNLYCIYINEFKAPQPNHPSTQYPESHTGPQNHNHINHKTRANKFKTSNKKTSLSSKSYSTNNTHVAATLRNTSNGNTVW